MIDISKLRTGTKPLTLGWGKPPVLPSPDLRRILELPRREKPDDVVSQALIELVTERYARPNPNCRCKVIDAKRPCIRTLRITQAWALYEIAVKRGLLGIINVGDGKTACDILAPLAMPSCRRALLLVPAKLIDQFILEYRMVREHFRVPSLIVHGKDVSHNVAGSPALHVSSYERFSNESCTVFLERVGPDTIIADECDALRNPGATRTGRVLRYFAENPETRFCGWTGSMTDSSIKDYAHLSCLALKEGSPLPLDPHVVDDWARALDPSDFPAPAGALERLCEPDEDLYSGFHRRLVSTEGVVTSTAPQVNAELVIRERLVPEIPAVIAEALQTLRETWTRPDGEEILEAIDLSRHAREIACGFFYRWVFKKGETVAEIEEWLRARKAWGRDMRNMLKSPQPYLDSPKLLARAAERGWQYPHKKRVLWYATVGDSEPLPHWKAESWPAWVKAKPLVNGGRTPDTEPVRLHPYLVEDAARWASENIGVVWYAFDEFGRWLSEISGLPLHSGGPDAGPRIGREKGDRSIIASIHSHGRGRDGLQYLFHRQLVAQPPASATSWQQTLGRLHRSGQASPVVYADFYRHTEEIAKQVDQAMSRASYVAGTIGQEQKLRAGWNTSLT